jgi:hypothetical protein
MKITDFANKSKYTNWYISIVGNAQKRSSTKRDAVDILGYCEAHHIVPRSIWKSRENVEVTYLTPKEHFICHRLLTKMVSDPKHRRSMFFAVAAFARDKTGNRISMTSMRYSIIRNAISEAMTGRDVSDTTREKLSQNRIGKPPANKGKKCKPTGPCTETRRSNISKSRINTEKINCIHCNKSVDPGNFKQFHGDLCRHNPNIDSKVLQERSERNRNSTMKSIKNGTHKTRNPKSDVPIICPHCNKIGWNYPTMKRFHFDSCKTLTIP